MAENLHEIVINNKVYGELNGVTVFLTDDLYKNLEKTPSRYGTLLKAFELGRALQGQKHIISIIKETNKDGKIIFNLRETKRSDNEYFINYNEYRRKSRARFFPFYRQTGLDAASYYLNGYFPEEFEYNANQLNEMELRKVNRQLPKVLGVVSDKNKNKLAIMEEATKTVSKLKRRTKVLKRALADLQRESSLSFYQQSLDELKSRLTKNYSETKGKHSWQKWIHSNDWIFGIQHLRPIPKERIGFDSIPDYVFPTRDGFLDILEIKKPTFPVIVKDSSHAGSYAWCSNTNRAIGQIVNYIQEVEKYQYPITEKINEQYSKEYGISFYLIRPRAFLLIGQSNDWSAEKRRALRRLKYSLHGIEVLTYTDLVSRGESIIHMLSKKGD